MGVLKQQGTGRSFAMGPRCVIGRDGGCHLRVDDRRISFEHADLRWQSDRWTLHDMGSRNGTFLEGRKLLPGEFAPLFQGATFTLGPDRGFVGFTLIDDSRPAASARNTKTFAVRKAQEGILVLPDDEHPEVTVFEDAGGHWVADGEETSRRVEDGEEIVAGGEPWKLSLTSAPDKTVTLPVESAIETTALRIAVSRNQEHVDVTVVCAGQEIRLTSKYLLVLLARARIDDADASPGERGWIDRDELCKMLGTSAHNLNVDVFRVRKKFANLGIRGAANIIERRPGDLRLGIDQVVVVDM